MVNTKQNHTGFTVVELLIATTVFGVVLLLAAMALIQVGKSYSRGINSTETQNAARAVLDEVTQSIQFSGGNDVTIEASSNIGGVPVQFFCTQEKRFIYARSVQLQDSPANHVFMSDNRGTGHPTQACPTPLSTGWPGPANQGVELLRPGMRLAKFKLDPIAGSNIYDLTIRVVFGDDDLLCSPTPSPGNCNSTTPSSPAVLQRDDLQCKNQGGGQYCGVSELSTSVQKRL